MSVFKLDWGEVARELRVVVLEDPGDFNARTEDMPPGVHVVDMPGNNLVVLSNKNVYKRWRHDKDIWLPLTYDKKARVGRVSKVVTNLNPSNRAIILLEDQRTMWGEKGVAGLDSEGIFNARDPMVRIARSDMRHYSANTYYPMLRNVPDKFIPPGVKINDVSMAYSACSAALSNDTMLVWGRVDFGGFHDGRPGFMSGGLKLLSVPGTRSRDKIVSLASGALHIAWVVEHEEEDGGWVCVYGNNGDKQCGIAATGFCKPMKLTTVPELYGTVKAVQCGPVSSFALTVGGRIFAWGWAYDGEFGSIAASDNAILPTEILPPKRGAIWLKMVCWKSSIALYGNTENKVSGVMTWGERGGIGRQEVWDDNPHPPRDIDFSPELMELLLEEDPKYVNLVRDRDTAHIIFTRDDFSFQEFDDEEVGERLEFGEESGMYERVERNRY